MSLVDFALGKKTSTLVLTLVLLVGGVFAFFGMGRLEDPAFTIKDAQIFTSYPGATPMEVRDEVTDLITGSIQQMAQLKEIKSQNLPGLSIITATIKDQYDSAKLPQVWDELRRKVSDVQRQLPPGAQPSVVYDDFGDVYGILLAVTSDGYTYEELQEYVKNLRKQLLLVKGVAKVTVWGERQEAVFVEISRAQMARYGLSVNTVYDTLRERNVVQASGQVKVGPEYIRIEPSGNIYTIQDLGELFINDPESKKLVALKDIASIIHGYVDPPQTIMRHNGAMSLAVGVSMMPGGNVVDLGKALDARLAELTPERPIGINIEKVYFQPTYVTQAISSFMISLAEALAIVIVVLMLFMGLKSGLLIGAVLLVTVLGSFIFMKMMSIDLQRISLGALIIALGMLVDNAIVITEGMMVRIESGMDKLKAARDIVNSNIWPLLGATVVAVLAFSAIGLSDDSTGEYCGSLFWVILISLMLSWLIAITVTPLFCTMLFTSKAQRGGTPAKDPYGGLFFRLYKSALDGCLRFRWLVLGLMLILLVASAMGLEHVDRSFFPDSTQPQFLVDYWLPQGTDIRVTSADLVELEHVFRKDARIVNVDTFVGAGAPRFMLVYAPENTNSAYGQLVVTVRDYLDITPLIEEYSAYIAERYPASSPKYKRIRLGPGGDNPIEARFLGPDAATLRTLSDQAQSIMREDPLSKDIRDDWRQKVKVLRPVLAEAQARLLGISRNDVASSLQSVFSGLTVGVYREDDKLLPIIAQPPLDERVDVNHINNALVFSPMTQGYIPLLQVVSGTRVQMQNAIVRTKDRKLCITASCDVRQGYASELFDRLKPKIEAIELPPGFTMEWGGEYENSSKAQAGLATSLPFSFALMVLITILLFNALRQPCIIWLTVPLAVIGVTVGLLTFKQPFGFMALLGFLSLTGMLIKNAIVLIDQIDQEIREGKPRHRAILESSVSRMRPVLMAVSTTVLGMLPLLADAFFVSMAVTIMAGLTFASILTLFVVPVLYALFFGVKSSEV